MSTPTLPRPPLPGWVQTLCYGIRPVPYLTWCQKRLGDVFTVSLPGGAPMVVLADPADIKQVMALGADDFTAASAAPLLEPFLGPRSLLLLDGERHQRERRQLVHSLHGGAMSDYATVMCDATRRDIETWPHDKPFALHPHLQSITLDVIVRLVFGADEASSRRDLQAALRPWLAQGGSYLLLLEPLRKELGGHGPWGRFATKRRRIDMLLDEHIAARRIAPDLAERHDVLSLLVQDDELDDRSLRDELMTMLAAGHDTSATALAWAVSLVWRDQRVLGRLLEEIESGEDTYLEAVVKEVLRLSPVVLEIGRALTHDVTIGDHTIPAGCSASASILLAQRRPDRYPDPLAFLPERFLGQPADPHTWLPFGGGVRRCIGAAFALLEIKAVLRTVLESVELEAVGPMDKPRRRAVTMIPSHGTRVRVRRVDPGRRASR